MATDPKSDGSSRRWPTIVNVPVRDAVVVLSGILAICAFSTFVVKEATTTDDAIKILGAVIPSVSVIVGAAFGVSAGAAVGGEVNRAAKETAENDAKEKGKKAAVVQTEVTELRNALGPIFNSIESLPSPAGRRVFGLTLADMPDLPEPITINAGDLAAVRERLARIDATLGSIAG